MTCLTLNRLQSLMVGRETMNCLLHILLSNNTHHFLPEKAGLVQCTQRKKTMKFFSSNSERFYPSIFCLIVFTSDHQTFSSSFKGRWHVIGSINHNIVMGLCSELLMRLSYYIDPGYGKTFLV